MKPERSPFYSDRFMNAKKAALFGAPRDAGSRDKILVR
jgi:hypothetical protein